MPRQDMHAGVGGGGGVPGLRQSSTLASQGTGGIGLVLGEDGCMHACTG